MDSGKIERALEELKSLRYIVKYGNSYKFTETGHGYTRRKSSNSWIMITQYNNTELWVRENPRRKDSWRFMSFDRITEEQFNDFCKYYDIKIEEPKQLEICNEIEFMDI